jgi:hypothetical protein
MPSSSTNPQLTSNVIAVFHYNYRSAGKVNELNDLGRVHPRINMSTANEAPQNVTFELRDEFGEFVRSCSFYSYWGDRQYFYGVGDSWVNPVSMLPLGYTANRHDGATNLPWAEFSGTYNPSPPYAAAVVSYYDYIYALMCDFCVRNVPPSNALCTDGDWVHILTQYSQ